MLQPRQLGMLVLLTLMWGTNWPMMKFSLRELTPLWFRALTMGGGALALALYFTWRGQNLRLPRSGAVVLVAYRNERGEWRRIRAQWIAAKSVEAGCDSEIGEYDEATDTYYDPEGWYESINNWDDYSAVMVYEGLTIALDAAACPADKRLTFELSGAARYSVTTPLERPVSRLVGDGHGL